MSPVKRICVFEHSVMTNFNCACPAIQRSQGSGFLSEGSSWLIACMSEQRRFWRDCADAQACLNLRCSHMRLVPNSLDAVQMLWSRYEIRPKWLEWQSRVRLYLTNNLYKEKHTTCIHIPLATQLHDDTRTRMLYKCVKMRIKSTLL